MVICILARKNEFSLCGQRLGTVFTKDYRLSNCYYCKLAQERIWLRTPHFDTDDSVTTKI